MSVKRYKVEELNCCFDADMVESPTGEYVEYFDYASLKAEVHRLEEIVGSDAIDRKYGMCCDASNEVARLKAEVERLEPELEQRCRELNLSIAQQAIQLRQIGELKAEVENLKKPAVIGGYNISQYIRMANSETLEFDNGDMFADMTLPERIKYIVESHASLRSVAEDNKRECEATRIENARFKAEVERLTAIVGADAIDREHGMCCDASAQVERLTKESDILQKCCEHQKNRIERLKQNEQLIDAGNALHDAAKIAVKWGVTATQMGMPRALYDALRNWNAAKEVQS